jgi:spore coat assembly protein
MKKIKKGDIVGRISYNKDIIFIVKDIKNKSNVILEGLFERIIADSDIFDLEIINKEDVKIKEFLKDLEIKKQEDRSNNQNVINGRILHLDGDKRYSEKSYRYYRKMGIDAVVKNIPERRQPVVVYNLLKIYNPDILVITGHDGMLKKGYGYYDIYNYRNSRYFISTVREARRYEQDTNSDLVIFAGACQSYFEALMQAGANFASSPARILIDILDPLIVAKEVALADNSKYIRIDDIESKLRDGKRGIGGTGANRKKA